MGINAGVWIDHHKAVIVRITEHGEATRQIDSDVENLAPSEGSPRSTNPYTRNDFVAEDKLQRKFASDLNKYYDEIITCIRDADATLILGPGEAKLELKKRIESKHLGDRVAELQTADKLTNPQIAANVRQYFAKQRSK
jgi:hypothetical protein